MDFKKAMSERTDEELVKIVTGEREGYQPSAVSAADEEIRSRNIDLKKFEEIKLNLDKSHYAQINFSDKKVGPLIRFLHNIVDTLAVFVVWLIYVFFLGAFSNSVEEINEVVYKILLVVSFFSYYIIMETVYQKTIGKFITKTKVVTLDGGVPKLVDIVRRTFCRLIPIDAISYLFTQDGLHDKLSDTTLIRCDN